MRGAFYIFTAEIITTQLMEPENILNDRFFQLPKSVPTDSTFRDFIKEQLCSQYLGHLCNIDVEQFIVNIDGEETFKETEALISIQKTFIDGLIKSLELYHDGQPAKAYSEFEKTMDTLIKNDSDALSMNVFTEGNSFYRIRLKKDNFPFSKQEMFHIPFELRGIVPTQRYSIPGFPSLYLSKTLYVAWEEMRRPSINEFQAIRLINERQVAYLDLTPPNLVMDILDSKAYRYLMIWPLVLCCSIKVKNVNDIFKPEYIIPQLLLQWIRNKDEVHGIKFSSTHINHQSTGDLYNIVFPVRENKDHGYCSTLTSYFKLTTPISWQLLEYATGGQNFIYNKDELKLIDDKIPKGLEVIEGRRYTYSYSVLGMLERYLDGLGYDWIS